LRRLLEWFEYTADELNAPWGAVECLAYVVEGATRSLWAAIAFRWRALTASAVVVAAVLATGAILWPRPSPPLAIATSTPRVTASPVPPVVVHVIGEVVTPGIYQLPAGSRASDAVAAAGGLTESADGSSLNLAARVVDGQQVAIKAKQVVAADAVPARTVAAQGGRVNLNAASIAELDALPGLGPVLAQRIVDRRQRSGPFLAIEQLRDEKLVPAATFERIKDLVAVD
jgi:competence protein ComEA